MAQKLNAGTYVGVPKLVSWDLKEYLEEDDFEGFWDYITHDGALETEEGRKDFFEAIKMLVNCDELEKALDKACEELHKRNKGVCVRTLGRNAISICEDDKCNECWKEWLLDGHTQGN